MEKKPTILEEIANSKEGDKAMETYLIVDRPNFTCKCPICGSINTRFGSGFGFMLASMRRHVPTCYGRELKKLNLTVEGGMLVKYKKLVREKNWRNNFPGDPNRYGYKGTITKK